MKDQLQWTAPSPLWAQASIAAEPAPRRALLRRPTILRFATDDFMQDFLNILEHDPARLPEYVARPETWRGPAAEPAPVKRAPAFARALSRLGLIASRQKSAATLIGSSGPVSSSLQALVGGSASVDGTKSLPLKLYQPAHQRFYLVASCLVCGRPGLPDHLVNAGLEERATFVIRRLLPRGRLDAHQRLPALDDTWEEYAFITTDNGLKWRRIPHEEPDTAASLLEGEEQLPLFSVAFTEDDSRRRRLLAGVIPVGKREALMGAGQLRQDGDPEPVHAPPQPVDPRTALMRSQVRDPWKNLIERADAAKAAQGPPLPSPPAPPSTDEAMPADAKATSLKAAREETQTLSWYILLDFAKFLERQLPRVWQALRGQTPSPAPSANESALVAAIGNVAVDQTGAPNLKTALANGVYTQADVKNNLREALLAIKGLAPASSKTAQQIEDDLERVTKSYDRAAPESLWPDFLFPLADPEFSLTTRVGGVQVPLNQERVNLFARLIEAALPQQAAAPAPKLPLAAQPVMDMREGWFVIRCVFERPRCGSIDPPLVSERTEPFQLANFFDPDAPARPLRIALPIDTTPAGLRKFDKNTAFMISDTLCGQIDRMKGISLGDLIRTVLPWPLHKDLSVPDGGPCQDGAGLSFGMICSLSIPIITICALLLLMIIVSLLNIIFRWLPFFILCFPLPGFKSKE
jgi:hypothetical protein